MGKSEKATFKLDSRLVSPVSHSSSRDKRKYVYNQFMKHSDEQVGQEEKKRREIE